MGYFPNGSEGMSYEEEFCFNCIHGQSDDLGCVLWGSQLVHNYEECNKNDSILHELIPRSADHLANLRCRMFIDVDAAKFIQRRHR